MVSVRGRVMFSVSVRVRIMVRVRKRLRVQVRVRVRFRDRSIAAMTPCPISLSWFSLKRGLLMGVGKPPWRWGVIWTGCSVGCKESYKDLDNSPRLHIT